MRRPADIARKADKYPQMITKDFKTDLKTPAYLHEIEGVWKNIHRPEAFSIQDKLSSRRF